jgi:hypothetical protein
MSLFETCSGLHIKCVLLFIYRLQARLLAVKGFHGISTVDAAMPLRAGVFITRPR